MAVSRLASPSAAQLAEAADLFDQYRAHYAEPSVPGQTARWLREQAMAGPLTVFTARRGTELAGLATSVSIPASLALGCFWQLRDLYVIPAARRRGIATALVGAVRQEAHAAGATRLSLQTEPGNTGALALYRRLGFVPVEDLAILVLPLPV